MPTDELERIVVVQPHFDDAVMGAGYLIAGHPGTTVVTVFGGRPPAYPETPTEWDALGGFKAGDDIVALRRGEDIAALAELGARRTGWSSAITSTSTRRSGTNLATSRRRSRRRCGISNRPRCSCRSVLANPDHDLTHRAARIVMDDLQDVAWYCYEDAGYCHLPGLLAWRISSLFNSGLVADAGDRARRARHRAQEPRARAYRSQLPPLHADHMLDARMAAPVQGAVLAPRPTARRVGGPRRCPRLTAFCTSRRWRRIATDPRARTRCSSNRRPRWRSWPTPPACATSAAPTCARSTAMRSAERRLSGCSRSARRRGARRSGRRCSIACAPDSSRSWPCTRPPTPVTAGTTTGVVGARFNGHPWTQSFTLDVLEPDHPALRHLGSTWQLARRGVPVPRSAP